MQNIIKLVAFILTAANAMSIDSGRCSANEECPSGCCSYWGYCGNSLEHCSPEFGCRSNCWSGPEQHQCGKGLKCPEGQCCSKWGYCGTGPEYCSRVHECQTNCSRFVESLTNNEPEPVIYECSADKMCNIGHCCSVAGHCGTTYDHCAKSAGCLNGCWPTDIQPPAGPSELSCNPTNVHNTCYLLGNLALTYDDGPGAYTADILDRLRDRGVKGTFFVVGVQVKKFPELLKRAYDEGHMIASHTYSHPDLATLTREQIIQEMNDTAQAIYDVIGVYPKYMRPPYGSYNETVLNLLFELGYGVVIWNLDTNDWRVNNAGGSSAEVYSNMISPLDQSPNIFSAGWMTLMHDLYQITADSQNPMISKIQEKGLKIVKVNDCLYDPYPYRSTLQ